MYKVFPFCQFEPFSGTFQKSKMLCVHPCVVFRWCICHIDQLAQGRKKDPPRASADGPQRCLQTVPPSFVPEDLLRRDAFVEVIFYAHWDLFRDNYTKGYRQTFRKSWDTPWRGSCATCPWILNSGWGFSSLEQTSKWYVECSKLGKFLSCIVLPAERAGNHYYGIRQELENIESVGKHVWWRKRGKAWNIQQARENMYQEESESRVEYAETWGKKYQEESVEHAASARKLVPNRRARIVYCCDCWKYFASFYKQLGEPRLPHD